MTATKRSLLALSAALVLLTPLAGAAASAAPATSAGPAANRGSTLTGPTPQDYPPVDQPAGDPCPFALHVEFPVNHVVAYTVTDTQGRVTTAFYRGALYAEITRTDTGAGITRNLSADGVQRFAPDGSSTLYGIGPFATTLHPGDRPGPELAVLHGASAVRFTADGHKQILYSSRIENVCTTLG